MANSTRVEHFTAPDIILKYWAILKNALAYLMANQDRKFCKTCFGEHFQKTFFLHYSRISQTSLSVCPR